MLFVYPPYQLLNALTNLYETWYVCHMSKISSNSPCICMCIPLFLLGKRSVKTLPQAKNTLSTIQEFLNASFSMRSVSYQNKVGD
jgi:hypothetical protein